MNGKTINNNIEEALCNFENSKLLKEAGFDVQLYNYYDLYGNLYHCKASIAKKKYNPSPNHLGADTISDFECRLSLMDNSLNEYTLAPTLQLAIDFLVENFPEIVKNYKNIPLCTAIKEEKEQFIQDILKLAE